MEGQKSTFNFRIDDQGTLCMDMVEFREAVKHHKNKAGIMTIEILDGGDCQMMLTKYRKGWLPKIVQAWKCFGERYTEDQADKQLRIHTTTCHKQWNGDIMIVTVDELGREELKNFMDEVALFCSQNLNTVLD